MDNDDTPVGRILSRREMIALLGASGGALFLGRAIGNQTRAATAAIPPATSTSRSCIARPELTEGPFFVDEGLNRSDIRSDPTTKRIATGVPLEIRFNVSKIGAACAPLPGALIDIWGCDALGNYSDIVENGTAGQKFLRGQQSTDAQGTAHFTTIFPGWYRGRAVHIHFKIRAQHEGKTREFTSQFFFDDAFTDAIHQKQPYAHNGARDRRNNEDGIFGEGGRELLLDLKPKGAGYATTFEIGLDLSQSSSRGGRHGGEQPPFFDW